MTTEAPLTMDSLRDKQTLLRTNIFTKLINKDPDNPTYVFKLEELIKAGMPMSAQYPAYWAGAMPGARAAALLSPPHRIVFSRKTLLITLVPMTEKEIAMFLTRVGQQRLKEKKKDTEKRQHVRDLVAKMVANSE